MSSSSHIQTALWLHFGLPDIVSESLPLFNRAIDKTQKKQQNETDKVLIFR
jgi:hypothetical protein